MSTRRYELVLLGATGYTGQLTAEYIQEHVTTDLRWAIAGRDAQRLSELATKLKTLMPDRLQPGIEAVQMEDSQLVELARKTQCLITTVGPYAKFGEPVVRACVEAGTHYLDVTGEITFTYDMLRKYHDKAKANGVCIIPQCAIDSVPADIVSYLSVKAMRDHHGSGTRDCVVSLQEMAGSLSGGTINSLLGLFEYYPSSYMKASLERYALCPDTIKQTSSTQTNHSASTGTRYVRELGALTDSVQAMTDVGLVNRSWYLFGDGAFYGPDFTFSEHMRVGNMLVAGVLHGIIQAAFIACRTSMFRNLIKKLAFQPGNGPDREKASKDILSYKGIATSDDDAERKSFATYRFDGSVYYMSGITVTEAALVLIRDGDCLAKRLGGVVTPATLEMAYLERLQNSGIKLEWGMV